MRRAALIAALALLLAATALSATPVTRAQSLAHGDTTGALRDSVAPVRINRPLQGIVLTWEGGRLVRLAGAHIGTGETALQTDATGRFSIPASIRTDRLNVVAPGYAVVRRTTTADYAVVLMRPLAEVRAIYVPYAQLDRPEVLDWVLGLGRSRVITSVVLDMKDDSGQVHPLFATDLARQAGSVKPLPTDIDGFLRDLDALGIYTIARVVTFRDSLFGRANPADAILTHGGEVMRDIQGLVWTNPFSETARRYNVEIAAEIAKRFDEVQFDYVRFPADADVAVRSATTSEERSAIIGRFLAEAATAIHAQGAAIAADTFGQTTLIEHDDGIGQVLEFMVPELDYYSPMVYPSTWTTGWFGLPYPPSDPYRVVLESVRTAVERMSTLGNVVVRPWLQDFHDYQEQSLPYGAAEVRLQIEAAAEAGGQGFMLWDPSLQYQLGVLAELAP